VLKPVYYCVCFVDKNNVLLKTHLTHFLSTA
jgi:hypothetical protein